MVLMNETSGRRVHTSDAPSSVASARTRRPTNSHVSSVRWGGREGRPIRCEWVRGIVSTCPAAEDSIVPRRRVCQGERTKIAGREKRGKGEGGKGSASPLLPFSLLFALLPAFPVVQDPVQIPAALNDPDVVPGLDERNSL